MSRRVAAWIVVACLAVPPSVFSGELPAGDAKAEGMKPEVLAKIQGVLEEAVAKKKVAGASTIVVRHGKVVHLATVGMRDVEAGKPMDRSTIFRVASMSKPITSAAVMVLVDDGKIKLDDPVAKFLPEFARPTVFTPHPEPGAAVTYEPAERPITIHQLLTHTSGLTYRFMGHPVLAPMYVEAAVSDGLAETPGTIGDNVKRLAKIPLMKQPGTAWDYSLSTDVLGRVIEVASGMTFDAFLRERLFKPLKMDDTGFLIPPAKQGRLSALYTPGPDGLIRRAPDTPVQMGALVFSANFPKWDTGTYYSGGAGLSSTIDDYARFLQMILNKGELEGVRVLKAETVKTMTTHQIGGFEIPPWGHGEGFGYGFGVVLPKNRDHDAAGPGAISWAGFFHTYFWVDVERETIGIIMSQIAPASGLEIGPNFKRLTCEAIEK